MRCDVATIERHLLALAGNWLAARGLHWDALHPLSVSARSKHFRRNSQSKLLLLQFSFLPLVVGFARASVSRANKLPSTPLPLPCLPSCLLCLGLPHFPWLIYSNVDAWRCLSTLFICICIFFLLPLPLLLPLFPSVCSFFVA